MDTEIVDPDLSNFVKSLRDVGYTFEIAVADIIDNSITAGASFIDILAVPEPDLKFEILDNGADMDEAERAFAAAWRKMPKWVVSRSLAQVGPNARLIEGDLENAVRKLKAERDGEIEVAGPTLAQSLTDLGLIDAYRIYLHPVVLGHGTPYFAGPRPPLHLMTADRIGEDVIRLTYVPT